ncbi:MAG TPA: hypothetical protein PK166_12040 [Candidatus Hydrogenedentes bacterium]|nr:hypothetical protein [Candidatus Hydrogenedentota bacterium]
MNTVSDVEHETACAAKILPRGLMVFCAAAILMACTAQGAVYYVSNAGSDSATGESPGAAWASLNRVCEATLQPGDSVLFERGGQWRGRLHPQSGGPGAQITYGAYGQGPKPLLMGSLEKNAPADWEDMGDNIWATTEPEPGHVELLPNGSFDEGLASWTTHTEEGATVEAARDTSVFDSAPASLKFRCVQGGRLGTHAQLYAVGIPIVRHALYQLSFRARCDVPVNLAPPTLMQRGAPWSNYGRPAPSVPAPVGPEWSSHRVWYAASETSADARLTFFLGESLPAGATLWLDSLSFVECEGDFFQNDAGNIVFDQEASVGVKVWNRADLDAQGEFCFDKTTWRLYLYSVGNPASRYSDIECAVNRHIIEQGRCHHITYENLALKYGAAHGIGGGSTHDIIVRNCDFSYIGGGELRMGDRIVRFGNAVEFWGPAYDNLVEGCRIWEIYDTGLSNQSGEPEAKQYNIHYRNNVVWNCEWLYEYWSRPESSSTHDIYFENNICAFAGYGWGHAQRADPHGRNVGMRRTEARLSNVFIRNNIFFESTQFLLDMAAWSHEDVATVILDNNCWFQTKGTSFLFGGRAYDASQFAAYQAESGKDPHSIWADPLFEDPARGDFRLKQASPCISAGIGIVAYTPDPSIPRH